MKDGTHIAPALLLLLVVVLSLIAAGCSSFRGPPVEDHASTWPDVTPPARRTDGAIYSEGLDIPLWENATARRVGDIITVRLLERTNASNSSSTSTAKSTAAALDGPKVLGRGVTVGGTPVLEGSLGNESKFDGSGSSKQTNRIDGDITVTVVRRLPNGNMLVRGQKWITINQSREFVRLQGMVRPFDVGPDNSVPSWRVADAEIAYGGRGTLANANRPGWLHRFFNSPLTPF
ncbi:MAG: flagellar basal body L-ring protein FlgH [Pseudomonadales bacterium]|nr:flagellar basal body L-ring protein FlgH [Pseudomonadales bacterium]